MSEDIALDKVDDGSEAVKSEDQNEAVKKLDLIVYSADQLMQLREVAVSKAWPSYLDEAFKNNRGTWDPDRWHQNKRKGSTPPPILEEPKEKGSNAKKDEGNENNGPNKKKDIKDRLIMTETEGIVLSPQRRSFITGCQVSKEPPKETNSSENGIKTQQESMRPPAENRRVGSGRIRPSSNQIEDYEPNRNRNNYSSDNSREESRYGFGNRGGPDRGNWYDRDRDSYDKRGGRNMNPRDRRDQMPPRKGRARDAEPEWMSAPVNQDDMMELKGFDESPEKETRVFKAEIEEKKIPIDLMKPIKGKDEFNIDDILHMDVIPGLSNILEDSDLLVDEKPDKESSGGSRFSQFFSSKTKEEQKNLDQCRRSSITEELHSEKMTSIKIPSPGDPSAYFAPISPAAKTENLHHVHQQQDINPIMEMLRSAGKTESELLGGQKAPPLPQMPDVKTAAEVEANIKRMVGLQGDVQNPPQHKQQSDAGEMSAFKKFAAMYQGNNGLDQDQNGGRPQRSSKDMNPQQQHQFHQQFQQQQQGQMRGGQGPVIRPSPIPANAPTEHDILAEMAMRHSEQQQQFRMPHGLPPGGLPPNGPPPTGGIQPSRDDVLMMAAQRKLIPELLKSPEANSLQAAVQNQGMNMLNTMLYQFVYGQMEPTRREILLQVIKYYQMKGAFGPQFASPHFLSIQESISPTSPTPAAQSQQSKNNLAISPIPGRERIPSPQELAIHTQQIMQNALIKRKLEEQKENFRRRQEQDQLRKGTDSPSFAFTPTVVMEKMAADRRDSDPKIPELDKMQRNPSPGINMIGPMPLPPSNSQQQLIFMQQQIRAQQLAAMQAGQPVDHRLLMQAQAAMMSGVPPGSGPAGPRPLPPSSVVPRFNMPDHNPGQIPPQNFSGGSQGLSRFFSPEVLAQAQSGNAPPLPPLPTQKAMTLEEIERHAAAVRM